MSDPSKICLDEALELSRAGKFREALSILQQIEEQGSPHPHLLVWKSRFLQIDPDPDPNVGLSEIEGILVEALEIDGEHLPALIDLGYFYLRVMDDAAKATPFFNKALELCLENASETIVGLTECISETESTQAAIEFLDKHENLKINVEKVQKELL